MLVAATRPQKIAALPLLSEACVVADMKQSDLSPVQSIAYVSLQIM